MQATPAPSAPAAPVPPAPALAAPAQPSNAAPNVSEGTNTAPQKLKPAAPPTKPGRIRKQWLPYVAAAVLTFCISLIFFSRQSIRASQTKAPTPAAVESQTAAPVEQPVAPAPQVATTPAPETPAAPEAATAAEPAAPKPSDEQVQMGQVKSLWAAGKYAQALEKVNDMLAAHPDNMEGRIWKKKIRDAQEAEAAMK
jgi:hypothetical protein